MKNLIAKEIKLCFSVINYIFIAFAVMVMIPNYPRYVPFFFVMVSVFYLFQNGEVNRDIMYSTILPIRKSDIVKSRCLIVAIYELAVLVVSIPFAILGAGTGLGNAAGINATFAFYGLVLIPITLFHLVFFTKFYKKGEKPGMPFLLGSIAFFISYIALEVPIFVGRAVSGNEGEVSGGVSGFLVKLDSQSLADVGAQIPVLVVGLVIYALGWVLTYKMSAKNFEKVDL